ncbi:DEAD/DEAH box helicase family protein [Vibrio alginolyticus]|uniref:EcoAI/FtnUII family type I restriction enzme subunit R n=1 Tax=Vibrio alginolyticus TaxID=663 RepID=UPI001BD31B1A|nr:DEAD/DEAH box helicase family protein [Vibrio alginolyticus]MBT0031127.1 DEAD/DEAH box helicase family protein [Vibrio alginolyticus]
MDKKLLSERDICTKFITPSIEKAEWKQHQFREEVNLTDGRVMVRGKLAARIKSPEKKGGPKRADYVLYAKPNLPIAVIEAKKNSYSVGHGIQQALNYAEMLDAPFAISSNGDAFLLHDRTGLTLPVERVLTLDEFPTLDQLWPIYQQWKGIETTQAQKIIEQPYYTDGTGKEPRYYQRVAINRTLEAIAKEQPRILLVMATGTGKTYTAFQIIWRLWKAKAKKRILFLADRNILVDQTIQQDFAPFGEFMHKVTNRQAKKSYEIYLALYQAVTGKEGWKQIYKQFPRDFFDLVVIDECHRGSAREDSAWHEILKYFDSATHIGLTATPKEVKPVDGQIINPEFNLKYFGEPIYTYSLKQGIEDGFLAPYKVIRIASNVDALGYTPEKGKTDKYGQEVEQRQYNTKDYDRNLVLEKRTRFVARKVWEYLSLTDPMAKTIIFCDQQDHAERMRQELVKLIPAAASNRRYVMRITGDDNEGKAQLSYFIDNDEPYPVIATTSKLLTTGVDAKTCKLIVLDQNINSMTEFKQIIGRGTRLREDYNKLYFTIMDFKGSTRLFSDPEFDGDPVIVYEPEPNDPVVPPEDNGDEPEPDFPEPPEDPDDPKEPRKKYVIDDVDVDLAAERSQYLDTDGKLITEDYRVLLKDQIEQSVRENFGTLSDFLKRWNESDRKQAIVEELAEHGIKLELLQQAIPNGEELDVFDLVAHVAFNQKPLTRKERANNVKKRDVFGKYGEQAKLVLETLVDKFAQHGVQDIENPKILELPPFDVLGSKTQIRRNIFGGLDKYQQAIKELENELYRDDLTA